MSFKSSDLADVKQVSVPNFKVNNCTFEDLRFGIDSEQSILNISNSQFIEIHRENGPSPRGIAINLNKSAYSIVKGNTMTNCLWGVSASGSNCDILDNRIGFDNSNYSEFGIRFSGMFGNVANVLVNDIDVAFVGLWMFNSNQTGNIVIDNNTIQGFWSPLFVHGTNASDPTMGIQVSNNTFYTDENSAVILHSEGFSIHDNEFYPISGAESVQALLQLVNADNNQIRNNILDGQEVTNQVLGAAESGGNLYCCNQTLESDIGVFFTMACGDTKFKTTSFGNHTTSLQYRSDAYTGPQINHGNDWNNSYGLDAWHRSGDPDFIDLSQYFVISLPNNIIPSSDWFQLVSGSILSCEVSSDCGEELWNIGGPSESDLQIAKGSLDGLLDVGAINWSEKIRLINKINKNPGLFADPNYLAFISENDTTELFSLAYITKSVIDIHQNISFSSDMMELHTQMINIMRQLDSLETIIEESNSVDSTIHERSRIPLLIQLHHLNNTTTGLRHAAIQYITNAINDLSYELSELITTTNYGETYKTVFSLYLDYLIGDGYLVPNQQTELYDEATKCYKDYSKGVIIARELYDMLSATRTDWSAYDDVCEENEKRARFEMEIIKENSLIIYPNPVKDMLTIQAERMTLEPGQLTIFKVNGHTVNNMMWSGHEISLNTSDWSTGVYLLSWKTATGELNKKIIK